MAATPTLECDGALSDLILQAARAAIPAHVDSLLTVPDVGPRNQPLMPLLLGLIDAAGVTARAVGDNAWDGSRPLDRELAADLAQQCRSIARTLESATDPVIAGWSLPSMTGKELA
jgi:hypothetical protein